MSSFFQDVISNDTLKLDWDFKLSLLTDLVRVSTSKLGHWCLIYITFFVKSDIELS